MMSHRGSNFGDFLSGLVIGGAIGYVAAMLSAPRPGEETRQMLRERGLELRDKAMETADKTGKLVAEKRATLEMQAESAADMARERVVEAREKVESRIDEVRQKASETMRRAADEVDPDSPTDMSGNINP